MKLLSTLAFIVKSYNFSFDPVVSYRTMLGHYILVYTSLFSVKNFSSVDARLALHCKHLLIYRETVVTIYIAASASWSSPTENPSLYLRVSVSSVRLKNVLKNQNRNAFIAVCTLVFRLVQRCFPEDVNHATVHLSMHTGRHRALE